MKTNLFNKQINFYEKYQKMISDRFEFQLIIIWLPWQQINLIKTNEFNYKKLNNNEQ